MAADGHMRSILEARGMGSEGEEGIEGWCRDGDKCGIRPFMIHIGEYGREVRREGGREGGRGEGGREGRREEREGREGGWGGEGGSDKEGGRARARKGE